MRRWKSVRVRVTALATAIVAAALLLADATLVISLENTLAGRAQNQAEELVGDTAKDLQANRPLQHRIGEDALRADIILQIQDQHGAVQTILPGPVNDRIYETTGGIYGATPGSALPVDDFPTLSTTDASGSTTVENSNGRVLIRRFGDDDNIIVQKLVQTSAGPRLITAVTPLAQVANSVDPVVRALQLGTPVLVLLVGVMTWWITGRSLRPIELLRREAESISHSNPNAKLPVPSTGDEVARLALTLNDMLARIDDSSRRQREFVSDASHELRSPITSMHVALEVASLHPNSTTVPELSSDLLQETTRMQNMVNGLLALARLEDGHATPLPAVDLAPAVEAATGESTAELLVEADASQIEGALRNLVDNARRHAKSTVEVSVVREPNSVTFVIDDDGPGIPNDQRERIFDRFTRLDEGRSRTDGGVGIGLALTRRIAERHHGSVIAEDSPLGGARFSLKLPLRQTATA